jgi:hypothetical protein
MTERTIAYSGRACDMACAAGDESVVARSDSGKDLAGRQTPG